MAHVLLLHSVYGLRPAVLAAAELLRGGGHTVATPDLYEGFVTGDLDAGMAFQREHGSAAFERAVAAAADLPAGTVYAGFSMGAWAASELIRHDPAPGGLVLLHSAGDVGTGERLPCPWQLHAAEGDEFATLDEIQEWEMAEPGGETFLYPGGGHIYTDADLPDYDATSADLTWRRVLAFLARI
ncbi:dienelactone hydrolase [Longispora fulva]|uniref:Dienelactone hydrolase n=1 Tax=Longispora fulva TaxID=619741 RepID=A0A8J7KLJ3_9ACTN|nr:dienelactone hydrolase family protein [Longispora fulva]MBG6139429.1 dienelactone hydrolase [Longispora fulva]GIG58928.1 dienelactone hydrolase [Longispora fulva]